MIPRPRSEDAARYNPGRWVCNIRPEKCGGVFRVYGQDMECPIREKCRAGWRNTYEWTPGSKQYGRFAELDVDVGRRVEHERRRAELRRLLGPPRPPPTKEQRERWDAAWKARRAAKRPKEEAPMRRQPFPCGEDCENCPFESCRYTDEEQDAMVAAERHERVLVRDRERHARERAREAADPEYRAHRKALHKVRQKRYYEAHKDALRAAARERQRRYREANTDVLRAQACERI